MLRGIRKASANWLGRAVMGVVMTLLAASFAVWGINDIFRGFGRTTLATIGKTEIPIEQFRQNYNQRVQQIGQQLRHPLTPEQINAFGIDREVLGQMIAQAGLDQQARQMGLSISDAEISRHIVNDPKFQSATGQFEHARFEQALRGIGYTEQRFVTEQRQTTLRRQIIDSMAGNIPVPQAWLNAANQFQNEERSIEYLMLDAAQAGDIPAPTAEELSKYFETRKILFRAPEYRKIETVVAVPSELAKTVEISDDDVKAAFEQRRSRYITPERRRVEQLVFPTMAEAQSAAERLKAGTSFADIAKERGFKEQDIDLGLVQKSAIIDPAVADVAFSLKEGEVSAPVQGRFGAVLVTVLKIEPEATKTLADVAPQIRNDLAAERAKTQAQTIHDKVEDERAGGATLQEAAQKLKLTVVTLDAVDRSGRDPNGNLVSGVPHAGDIVSAAFASDVNVDNDPFEADGGYIWYNVAAIMPAHDRPLDEVKNAVEQRWRADEVASRIKAKAADILDKLKSGSTLEAQASANGVKVETAQNLKRGPARGSISAKVIEAVFRTAKDGVASAEGDQPIQWFVFRVTDVKTPSFNAGSPDDKRIQQTLQRQLSDDLFGQYVAWLEDNLGTKINQSVLAQAVGGGLPDTGGGLPDTD